MPVYDENDPKLQGYAPLEDYQKKDMDRSSRRIRDMPYGKIKESGKISPTEMDFGSLNVGVASHQHVAILKNNGYDDLNINEIIIVGDFVMTTDCGTSLARGEMCQINIQFIPKSEGTLTGGVYVDTGEAAGNKFIKLSGFGGNQNV